MQVMNHDLPLRFGPVLRRLREQQRWSQEYLALKAEINRSYLGEIERGLAVPTLATMSKLSSALEMRLSTLLALCEQGDQVDPAPGSASDRLARID